MLNNPLTFLLFEQFLQFHLPTMLCVLLLQAVLGALARHTRLTFHCFFLHSMKDYL